MFHLAAMVLLLAGVLAPVAAVQPVAASASVLQQEDGTPPPVPAPYAVVVVGDFQASLGCGDFDVECGQTTLTQNPDGTWTGFLQIPAGSYSYQIVARADVDRTLGEDGELDGDPISFDAQDGGLGHFFSYNQLTGEIYDVAVSNALDLITDEGTIAGVPTEDGGFRFTVDGAPGASVGVQLSIDGSPVGDPFPVDLGNGGRAVVTIGADGGADFETVEPATLTVSKTDEAGAPLAGSCFSVYDGNDVAGQACDADDGEDGTTVIRFPFGAGGNLELAESLTPEGQGTAERQGISLDAGDNVVQVVAAGGEGPDDGDDDPDDGDDDPDGGEETPIVEPGGDTVTVDFALIDEAGNLVPGGCLSIDGVGEQCDDDQDGVVSFELTPNTSYTITETVAPDGYEIFGSATFDVGDEGLQLQIPHTPGDGGDIDGPDDEETPTEEPEDEQGFGSLIALTVDADGNPVGGVCYNVSGLDEIACDEDGDGDMGLIDTVPAGEVQVSQASVPEGYDLDPDTETVEVESGEQTTVEFQSPLTQGDEETPTEETDDGDDTVPTGGNGNLDIAVTDADGFAIVGACVAYTGPVSGEVCDGGDGDLNPDDGFIRVELPAGDYQIASGQLPPGFEPAEGGTVTVTAGEDATGTLISGAAVEDDTPTPELPTETPEPENGSVLIRKLDAERESLAGSCFQLVAEDGTTIDLCDGDANDDDDRDGRIQFLDVPAGTYQLVETRAPDGYLAAEPQEIVVTAGEETRVNITNVRATGTLQITTTDGATPIGGSCYDLSGAGQFCDEDGDGVVVVTDVQPGDYTVTQASVADGYTTSDPASQDVTVIAGETATLTFTVTLAQGSIEITTTDEGGTPLAGAAYSVDGGDPVADEDGDGVITVEGVSEGDHAVSQTSVPEGYVAAADQTVTVESGETTEVTFVSTLATGSISVTVTDAAGTGLTGFCVGVDGAEQVCDDGSGTATIGDVAPGEHIVALTQAPTGYDGAEDQTITVVAGETAQVVFQVALSVGSIEVEVVDTGSGEPVAGASVTVTGVDGTTTTVEDNGDGDSDDDDGQFQIDGLTPGEYTVSVGRVPEGYTVPQNGATVTVESGQTAEAQLPLSLIPPTETPTEVPTETPTEVPTETATEVPTETATEVPTETATEVPTETATEVPTETATEVPVEEPTETPTTEAEAPTETATEDDPIVIPPDDPTETATPAPTEEPIEEPVLGNLRVSVATEAGEPVAGACVALTGASEVGPICDNDDGDTDPTDGVIQIDGIPAGDYVASQTSAPEGYSPPADQPVTIVADETAELTFTDTTVVPATGQVRIVSVDAEGNPAGGGSYAVGGTTATDNGDNDTDAAPGVILISGVVVGSYEVTETAAPAGQQPAGPQPAEVVADEVVEVTFTHEAAEPETGGVQIELTDADGNPAEGECVVLSSETNGVDGQELCDNGDGDTNPEPGLLEVDELPVGSYSVTQAAPEAPEEAAAFAAAGAGDERTFTVQANVIIVVVIIIIVDLPDVGDLQILKRALDSNALQTGVCFQVTGEGNDIEVCDNDDLDENGSSGIIRLSDLAAGSYEIEETAWPAGYEPAAPRTVTVPAGGTRTVVFKNPPVADGTGSLTVLKVDPAGDPLTGSCFRLLDGAATVATVCDDDDGDNDGEILFADVDAGAGYTLRETTPPSPDYELAADVPVTIVGGDDDQTITVVNVLRPGAVRIRKVADDGVTLLPGACFELQRSGSSSFDACDNEAGDSNGAVGVIRFGNVPAGEWTIVEIVPPAGYDPAPDETVTVEPGATVQITIENTPSTPPTETGTLVVRKLVDGELAGGACFSLRLGQVTKYAACDGPNNDGLIEFEDIGADDYTLHETKAPNPSNDFVLAADVDVTVEADETTTVEVTNVRKPGRILIIKRNTQGNELQGGCFRITPDPNNAGVKCSGANGQVSFDNLPVGQSYRVRETKAPNGYERAADKTGIVVRPGLTTTVVVVDKRTPPPPTDGSILVIKFFCPAGKAGEVTTVLDSSNPNSQELVQTVGCERGNATFTLQPSEGDGFAFSTGADGQYLTTLPQGQWELSETSPAKQTESVRIFAGQQTTVVVIDYVRPPAPKPGTVNVIKYTCGAGFEGTYYADFLANCTAETQKTNNVSFRVAGPSVGSRATGAAGVKGQASFVQLKAGAYTVTEQAPSSAVTVYAWCGVDLDNPDYYSATGAVNIQVGQGATVNCLFFNVPDEISDSTGALVVHKYVCDAAAYPANYDYFANCAVEDGGTKFAISYRQSSKFVPKTTGVTNPNGILSFGRLQPGTYQLKEVGADWCYARSDSVDAQGNIIVKAGERSNVYIFNCVPPKSPPNTGVGTAAAAAPAAAASAAGLLNLMVPGLGLAGLGLRRRLRGRKAA